MLALARILGRRVTNFIGKTEGSPSYGTILSTMTANKCLQIALSIKTWQLQQLVKLEEIIYNLYLLNFVIKKNLSASITFRECHCVFCLDFMQWQSNFIRIAKNRSKIGLSASATFLSTSVIFRECHCGRNFEPWRIKLIKISLIKFISKCLHWFINKKQKIKKLVIINKWTREKNL